MSHFKTKWNKDDIFQFLDVYEQFPILWNIKHTDYLNRNLKNSNFEKLKNNLSTIELVDSDQLRLNGNYTTSNYLYLNIVYMK
jgi:uncharacterized protein YecE (DUF72 family)